MEKFTKVNEHIILKIQCEFVNRSDIVESIREGDILDLNKKIPTKRILAEDEPIRAELENDSLELMWNIKLRIM